MLELSAAEARMLALSGLGMRGVPTPDGRKATAKDALKHLGLFQIDSVNVFERAHHMPSFSRVGTYNKEDLGLFRPVAAGERSDFVEYWAHEASVILTEDLPLYGWRMDNAKKLKGRTWQFLEANRDLSAWITTELETRGPLTVVDLDHDRNKRKGTWWGWSDVKSVLEAMFMFGELTSAGRDNFSRRYALPQQVLPTSVIDRLHTADNVESRKTLLTQAIDVLAVATVKDLNDYHRQWGTYTKHEYDRALAELVEAGTLTPVKVTGWKDKAYLGPRARRELNEATPGTNPTTILSPFDPVVWNRDRAVRLFDFDYKIEIYTPQEKRIYGYYTLPLLHKGELVGRIDLKSDRKLGLLLVQASWHEPELSSKRVDEVARDLGKHLGEVAAWQGLSEIQIAQKGNLASALRSASQSHADA